MKHEITMKEVESMFVKGIDTFSKKDNSPRGCKTVSFYDLQVGTKL